MGWVTVVRLDESAGVELEFGLDEILVELVTTGQAHPQQLAHGAWCSVVGR